MIPLLMATILPHHGKLSHQLVVWSPQHVALGQSHRRAWNGRHANADVFIPYFFNTAVIDLPECGGRATYLDCSQRLSFRGFGHCIDTFVSTLTKQLRCHSNTSTSSSYYHGTAVIDVPECGDNCRPLRLFTAPWVQRS